MSISALQAFINCMPRTTLLQPHVSFVAGLGVEATPFSSSRIAIHYLDLVAAEPKDHTLHLLVLLAKLEEVGYIAAWNFGDATLFSNSCHRLGMTIWEEEKGGCYICSRVPGRDKE
jgi:hypothetical protein